MNLNLTGRRASAPGRRASAPGRGTASPVRGDVALLLITTIFFCAVSASAFAGGIKDRNLEPARTGTRILVQSDPTEKPRWVDIVPQSETEIFFVGTSQIFDTPANARDNARESARIQVLEYYGQVIEKQAVSLSAVSGSTRDTLAAYVVREDEIRTFAQNVVSEVGTLAYYTEMYLNSNNKEEYIVYTLHQINRQKAEDEISGFAKNLSEQYTAAFSQWNTLKAALEGYTFVAKALEQNPLHRIMAYFETSAGKAGLYEYTRLQINELSNSVRIEAIPARTIQETENLTTRISIHSSILPTTGLLDCQARIFGIGSDDIIYPFRTASEDPYNLQIRNIKPGSYNVTIEILLSGLTGEIAKNIGGGFSFDVRPLNVILGNPAAVEAGIKRAVDTLAMKLQTQTETVIGPFTMTGTDIPSELSVYLMEKVTHYAKNNQERKYRVMEGGIEQAAFFSGFFTKRNDRVDLTFELATPNGDRDGSYIFSISVDVLENIIGIAIEPDNVNDMIILDEVVPVATIETIHIEAKLNSNTRTYKHGDYLKLTVTADRDCYFKIIHIDVDNQIKMIYPTRNDNNYLSANASRTVFDNPNSRYVFSGPYGAETLVVVASPVQFPNIEREYNEPWKAATEEAIKAAISGAGQGRYPITITKPHEEYEYSRPENMTEFYQAIRDDAGRQGGYFEGNAASGFYIINNIRGSYLVPGDKPDTIEFTAYFLDTYTANAYRGVRTRGSPFNFTFARPQNISQAVQMVRSSIQEKGGTFTGNEQQGNFSSKGIAGQYQVSDVVNVTISEKPFVVPNSLIENEVKKYFGVR
jgi:hypothetical protein